MPPKHNNANPIESWIWDAASLPARRRVPGWPPATWTMSEPTNEIAHGSPTGYAVIPDENIQRTVTTKAAE